MPLTLRRQPDLHDGQPDYHVMLDGSYVGRIYRVGGHEPGWRWGCSFPGDPPGKNGGFVETFDEAKAKVRERAAMAEERARGKDDG